MQDQVARRVQKYAGPAAGTCYALWILVAVAVGPRNYQTNDDPAMQALASGDFTGMPDARWVYSGPLTAWPITSLYRLADLPWYALAQYSMQALAGASIAAVLVRRRQEIGLVATAASLAVLVAIQYRMLLLLSFTGTAFITGFAAVALMLDLAFEDIRERRLATVATIILFTCAASVRSDVLPAVAVVSLAAVLLALWHGKRWAGLFAITPVATLVVNHFLVRTFTDGRYQDYLSYNRLRGSLQDTPRVSGEALPPELLSEIGWSTTDRALFGLFVFDDWELFGTERLERVAALTSSSRTALTMDVVINRVVLAYPGVFMALGIILAVSLARRRWAALGAQLFSIGLASAAMAWIAITARLPERVSLPMWLGVVVIVAITGSLTPAKSPRNDRRIWMRESWWVAGAAGSAVIVLSQLASGSAQIGVMVWVALAATAAIAACAVAASAKGRTRSDTRTRSAPQGLVLALAVGVIVFDLLARGPVGFGATQAWASTISSWYHSQMDLLDARPPGTTVIASGSALWTQGMDPLGPGTVFQDPNYISLGWWNFSPMYEYRKTLLASPGSMDAIRHDESILWFGKGNETQYYNAYIVRGLPPADPQIGLQAIGCASLQPQTCLWQLREIEPVDETASP